MVININAGHGPNDVRGFKPVDNLDECSEGQNNFRVYELVRKGLEHYRDVSVTTARVAMSDNPGLTTRGVAGKGADLQLHLHSNAGGGHGPEMLLRPDASDNAVELAKEIRAQIRAVTGLPERNLKFPILENGSLVWKTTRGPGESYFTELNKSEAKDVILIEMAFHDDLDEARILRTKRQDIAYALVKAIADHYGLKPKQDRINGPYVNEAGERLWFRAFAGSYKTRAEAEEVIKKLEADGYTDAWLMAALVKEK